MADKRIAVEDLAGAVLDGTPVDWEAAQTTGPVADRELIPHLRLVARIAQAHRTDHGPDPATWAHFEIRARLGSGAFGDVYRAWDSRLEREVALKLLKESDEKGANSSVIAEAALLARVRHPNIVTVHGAERAAGRVGVWMELIEGRSLDRVLRERGPFGGQEAAIVGLTVCRALSAVHRAGLLHRDVKAQNVMREDGGRILLMDFGTGRLIDAGRVPVALAGTPLYVAPELLSGAAPTVASDIYSVGVLLFHLTTTRFPVTAPDLDGLRAAHGAGQRRFLRDERPDLPDAFVGVVERAIAPGASSRYQSAGAMEAALEAVIGSRQQEGAAPRRRVWAASLLAASVVLASFAALIPGRGAPGRSASDDDGTTARPAGAAAAGTIGSSVIVRQVDLPAGMLVGRPAPDGRMFSYTTEDGDLALAGLPSGPGRRLTRHEPETEQHALHSAISADGAFVAYTWMALDGSYEMRVIGADGRRPRVLLRSESVDEAQPLEWSRDGASILSVLTAADGSNRLALVDANGAGATALHEVGPAPHHASRSPDGSHIVFDAPQAPPGDARDIFIMDADGRNVRPLSVHPADDIAPVWTADGTRVLFVSDRSGALDLWSLAVEDGAAVREAEVAHRNIGRLRFLGLTDRGAYYYQSLTGAVDVYTADLAADGSVARPTPLATGYAGSNISSAWSPDGRRIAYASRRGTASVGRPSTALAIVDVESAKRVDLEAALSHFVVRSWSPDGKRVLVQGTDLRGHSGLFAIDVESAAVDAVVVADRPSDDSSVGSGNFMNDGRVLYRRRNAIVARDLQTGHEEVLLDSTAEKIAGVDGGPGGRGFSTTADGRMLGFSALVDDAAGQGTSLRIKAAGKPSRELLRAPRSERLILQQLSSDGRTVFFTRRREGERQTLWRMSTDGGDPELLAIDLKAVREVSVSPDARRLTFTAGVPSLEVWVVENFLR